MIRRLRAWLRRRGQSQRLENCSTCGKELDAKREHELRAYANDWAEAELRSQGGGTYMAESYCAKHCPGGCERGCTSASFS